MYAYDSFHFYPETLNTEKLISGRFLGDIDGNDKRGQEDAALLWAYIKGESDPIDEKTADINFDGKVDVTDAVLLDCFVNGRAVDVDNIPIDGLAPTVQIAFLNGDDYDNIQYKWTERGGYITLPELDIEAPEGKKLSYDVGMVGETVRITNPMTVVNVKWIDANTPDYSQPDSSDPYSSSDLDSSSPDSSSVSDPISVPDDSSSIDKCSDLGDVNGDGVIDIEDTVAIIQHINGMTPLKEDEEKRADVSKDNTVDIDDAVTIISYINGNSTF